MIFDDEDRPYRDLPDNIGLDLLAFSIVICVMFGVAGLLSLLSP